MTTQALNLEIENATFFKNQDNTYTVHQRIGENGMLIIPKVLITVNAEAIIDESTKDFWQWIEYEKAQSECKKLNKMKVLLGKIKAFLKGENKA